MNAKFQWSGKHVLWTMANGLIKAIPIVAGMLVWEFISANDNGKAIANGYNLGYEEAIEALEKESGEDEVTED